MEQLFLLRFIERIAIVAGGVFCIYLGYRLFDRAKERQGELAIKTGTQLQLKISDVAPGIYFALFGTVLLGYAVFTKMEWGPTEPSWSEGRVSYSIGARRFDERAVEELVAESYREIYVALRDQEEMLTILNSGRHFSGEFGQQAFTASKAALQEVSPSGTYRAMVDSAESAENLLDFVRSYRSFLVAKHISIEGLLGNFEIVNESPHLELDLRYRLLDYNGEPQRIFEAARERDYQLLWMLFDGLSAYRPISTEFARSEAAKIVAEEPFVSLLSSDHNRVTLLFAIKAYIPYVFNVHGRPVQTP